MSSRLPKFQPSVHQIPTPGTENERPPRYEPLVLNFWFIRAASLLMILLGTVLQVVLFLSETWNGFPVPAKNVFSFVSTQFLTSFFPTLIAVPLAHFWTQADWLLRWYQPYVTLSQGGAPASRSILLDYIAFGQLDTLYHSWIYKHYLITISTLIALSVILLQPLAGSLLQVRKVPHTLDSTALLMGTLGLSPNIDNLDGFFASAGFALASVYNNQVDPPFVHDEWAAGEFQAQPGAYLNGTLAVNTTAVQTELNCASPSSLNLTTNADGSHNALATFSDGCSASNVFNPSGGTEQFSVVNVSSCGASGLDVKFQPVVFWFYLNSSSPQVASVYCSPTMNVFTVETSMNLTTASLGDCTIIDPVQGTNNVTGSPQYGRPYNGQVPTMLSFVVFGSIQDPYVSSRALAVNFGLPDAIHRYASRQPGGLLSVFQDQYGFLNATENIYAKYLSIAAQINYFITGNSTTPAQLTTEIPRLFVEALPAFILSSLMITIGFIGFGVHYLHGRARRRLWLTSPPGSIGAIVSLTSRSGFGQLLLPYDNERQMQERLGGLTFRIDERTGAIVADEDFGAVESSDGVALLAHQRPYGDDSTPLKSSDDAA
ncbi:hypothetical protein L210DRAFT_3454427 [Boletus edulis BED1]|uniref:Uncharacterized protein n=1 Tax=Boletus edulis BED1 TaxID=1328754 RepID=A0AAD4BKX8_BOLED|nr:hypothetical protein L210DRAFT_3454427 [Boletus edulis BED1]